MIRKIERADGVRWQVYIQAKGAKKYVGTFDSEREATEQEEDARVTQRKVDRGELAPDLDLRRTFEEAAVEWLKSLEGKSRSHSIYARRMTRHIYPQLGGTVLARIHTGHLVRWRDWLSHKVSAATVNTTIGTLSTAFEAFKESGWITVNPCHGLKRLDEAPVMWEWLRNTEQITRLLAACPESIRPIIAVCAGTGMRIDEVLHLQWDDVDLDHRLLQVHRGRQGTTKSGKARPVPIFDSVLPLFKELKLKRGDNVLVFPNAAGKARSKPGVSVPFKEAVVRAGLPKRLRPHDLRHSFAVLYLLDGGDLHRLSRILGHSTVVTTERCYLRFKPAGFDLDYGRVRFDVPTDGKVIPFAAVR